MIDGCNPGLHPKQVGAVPVPLTMAQAVQFDIRDEQLIQVA
jgi:hypothetical protein